MKKTLFTILFLAFITSAISQSNDYIRASYKFAYKPSKKYKDIIKEEEMILLINEGFSQFISLGKYLRDSIFSLEDSKRSMFFKLKNLARSSWFEVVKKDRELGKTIVIDNILGDNFTYEEAFMELQWSLLTEKKIIKSFNCQKATTHFAGRDYIAWFTNEIPISEGPYKFNGLPGLIVEIYDSEDDYHYALTSFKRLKTPFLSPEDKNDYFKVDKKKFFQLRKEIFEEFFIRIGFQYGELEENENEEREMIKEGFMPSDNPIELIEF